MFQIIIKVSSKENVKMNVDQSTTIQNIQDRLNESECNYFHKNKILDHNKTLVEQNVQVDDLLIQMKKHTKQQKIRIDEEQIKLNNAEDYKKQVLELIDKGYKREDVVQSMRTYNYNLQQVIQNLIYGRRKLVDDDDLEEIKDKLMNMNELKSIIQCIKSDTFDEFYSIQQRDRKSFNEFMQNSQAFVELLSELLN